MSRHRRPSIRRGSWTVTHHRAGAGALHHLPFPDDDGHHLWVCEPNRVALVLGSRQLIGAADADALDAVDAELTRRRSGGGAVWIEPGACLWADLLVPRGSPWHHEDLADTFRWAGSLWQAALAAVGVKTDMVTDRPPPSPDAAIACWAGLGFGELTMDGIKVVGLSQRRTRWGSRIQGIADLGGSAGRVGDVLAVDAATRARIAAAARRFGLGIEPDRLTDALLAHLP